MFFHYPKDHAGTLKYCRDQRKWYPDRLKVGVLEGNISRNENKGCYGYVI